MAYWLLKTEPEEFSFDTLTAHPGSCWDGVRNVEARNNLRKMNIGDLAFIYHTGKQKALVGLARITKPAYVDPSSSRPIWSAVDVTAIKPLAREVTLSEVKSDPRLATCLLARRPRLSVMPIEDEHWALLLERAATSL